MKRSPSETFDTQPKRIHLPENSSNDTSATVNPSLEECAIKELKLSPLENQIQKLKENNPNTILFVECGYKYRFFGDDAAVVEKELNIRTNVYRNYLSASVPKHRLNIHVKRLLHKGYKVGIVKQIEKPGIKSLGPNRSQPLKRQILHLFTRGTYLQGNKNSIEDDQDELTDGPIVAISECASKKRHCMEVSVVVRTSINDEAEKNT